MTGGYIFSLSTLLGGGSQSSLGQGGVPDPALDGGGRVSIWPWTEGYPNLGQGGTPFLGGYPPSKGKNF